MSCNAVQVKLFLLIMFSTRVLCIGYHGIKLHMPTKTEMLFKGFNTKLVEIEYLASEDLGLLKAFFLDNLKSLEYIESELKEIAEGIDVKDLLERITSTLTVGVTLVAALDSRFEYYPSVDRAKNKDRCIMTFRLYGNELNNLKSIDKHFMEIKKVLGATNPAEEFAQDITTGTIRTLRSQSKEFELFDDLEKIWLFMYNLYVRIFNNNLHISKLVGSNFDNSQFSLFETKREECKMEAPENAKITIDRCHSISTGTLCYGTLSVGKNPTQVVKYEPIFFDHCGLDHIYYLDERSHSPYDLVCLTKEPEKFNCFLSTPSECTLAILATEITRIQKSCKLKYSEDKYLKGIEIFAFFELKDEDKALLYSAIPQLSPDSMTAPLILHSGKYTLNFKSVALVYNFGPRLEVIRPQLTFDRALLCPRNMTKLITIEDNSSVLEILIISSIIPIIISLAALCVYSGKFFAKKTRHHRQHRSRRSNRRTRRRREENEMNAFIELLTTRTN